MQCVFRTIFRPLLNLKLKYRITDFFFIKCKNITNKTTIKINPLNMNPYYE